MYSRMVTVMGIQVLHTNGEPVPQDGTDQWLKPIKPEKLDSAGFAEDFSLHYKSVRRKNGER